MTRLKEVPGSFIIAWMWGEQLKLNNMTYNFSVAFRPGDSVVHYAIEIDF